MFNSARLVVSDEAPGSGELHQLFRDQELRCGNVEEWSLPHLTAVAAQDVNAFVRVDGTLVGAGLSDGPELLLAVAFDEGFDRAQIATTLLASASSSRECWLPSHDRDLPVALAAEGWRPSIVDLQMRLRLRTMAQRPLPRGLRQLALGASADDVVLHRAVHRLAYDAFGVDSHLDEFLDRYVRRPAYDAGLWVLVQDSEGVCGAAIGQIEQLPDATVGKVASLAVAPRARGQGLARAILNQLCRRFASRGLLLAQLGVHEDNRSGAPSMYRHLGWAQVSSRTRWEPGT